MPSLTPPTSAASEAATAIAIATLSSSVSLPPRQFRSPPPTLYPHPPSPRLPEPSFPEIAKSTPYPPTHHPRATASSRLLSYPPSPRSWRLNPPPPWFRATGKKIPPWCHHEVPEAPAFPAQISPISGSRRGRSTSCCVRRFRHPAALISSPPLASGVVLWPPVCRLLSTCTCRAVGGGKHGEVVLPGWHLILFPIPVLDARRPPCVCMP
jgi:hypothetical protein